MVHIIPLEPYQQTISQTRDILKTLEEQMEFDSRKILNNKLIIIAAKVDQSQRNLNDILPNRIKRGLINGLGTIIKDITGNLDNQDLQDIQNTLYEFGQIQDKFQENNNKQVIINKQMITRIDDLKSNLETNLKIINTTIHKTIGKLSEFASLMIYDQQLYRLEYTIENLNQHLEDLLDIITFSKNRIISRHLLNDNEMQYIKDMLNENNISIPHESAILNLLKIKGLISKDKQLIFLINIPKFQNEIFQLYKIIPIPVNNKIIFPIPPKFIILNSYQYKYQSLDTCQAIYGTYYCQEDKLLPITNTCAPAIINLQKAFCNYTTVKPDIVISNIDETNFFISPGENTLEFTSNCTRKTNRINQPSIITLTSCFIRINDQIVQV